MQATVALLAGVPGVFFDDHDACERCLVPDECEELGERPDVQNATHVAGFLGPVADAGQLLDVQDAAAGSHGVNILPADVVILALDPSGLSSLAAFDHAGLALFLQRLPVAEVLSSGMAQRVAVELDDAPSGKDGEIDEADVKSEMRTVLTRNILGLDGKHPVRMLAALVELENAVGPSGSGAARLRIQGSEATGIRRVW